MAISRMELMELVSKAGDGDVDFLREGVRKEPLPVLDARDDVDTAMRDSFTSGVRPL